MAAMPETMSRPVPPWRQKLDSFWRWWTGELVQLLPDRLARGSRVPLLALEAGDVVLVEPRSVAGPESRVAASTLDLAGARVAVRQLLERAGETRLRARLRLDRDAALVRRVNMPAATEENLAQVVAFEMDRLTPFRAEDVYFDQRVLSRDPASGQIGVELAVAQRVSVDAAVARMRELGVSVQGVAIRDDSGAPTLDLLPSEQRGERESANERLLRNSLLAAVLVLLLVALILPVWQKREAVVAMLPAIAKARQEAEATDSVVRSLERQVADYNFMQARRHAPTSLAFLEELSRLLPDNTWVQQFDLRTVGKGREVQITGETVSSSRLIELLEQSTMLQNSAPRGTVTRGSQPGTERFMIAAEARPKAAPEPLPAREIALPAAQPALPVAAAAVEPAAAPPDPQAAAPEDEPRAEAPLAPAPAKPTTPAKVEPVPRPRPQPLAADVKARVEERARRMEEEKQRMAERRRAAEARRQQQQQHQLQRQVQPPVGGAVR